MQCGLQDGKNFVSTNIHNLVEQWFPKKTTTTDITPSTAGFVAYDSLTQATILGWTEVSDALTASNTQVNQESWINSVKTPPTPTHVNKDLPF